jgi:hypothetical protein
MEFSDDEKELAAKQAKNRAKKTKKATTVQDNIPVQQRPPAPAVTVAAFYPYPSYPCYPYPVPFNGSYPYYPPPQYPPPFYPPPQP